MARSECTLAALQAAGGSWAPAVRWGHGEWPPIHLSVSSFHEDVGTAVEARIFPPPTPSRQSACAWLGGGEFLLRMDSNQENTSAKDKVYLSASALRNLETGKETEWTDLTNCEALLKHLQKNSVWLHMVCHNFMWVPVKPAYTCSVGFVPLCTCQTRKSYSRII